MRTVLLLALLASALALSIDRLKKNHAHMHEFEHIKHHSTFHMAMQTGESPIDGNDYAPGEPPAGDSENVLTADGELDAATVLGMFSQADQNAATTTDEDRCGVTVAIAAAINKGKDTLIALFNWAKALRSNSVATRVALTNAVTKLQSGRGFTYKVLGQAADAIYRVTASVHRRTGKKDLGLSAGQISKIFLNGDGITPDEALYDSEQPDFDFYQFAEGDSWPMLIKWSDGGGHFILWGALADGSMFVYDPYPLSQAKQLFLEGDAEYDSYTDFANNLSGAGTGWTPSNNAAAAAEIIASQATVPGGVTGGLQ